MTGTHRAPSPGLFHKHKPVCTWVEETAAERIEHQECDTCGDPLPPVRIPVRVPGTDERGGSK